MHLNQFGDSFRDEHGGFETTQYAREAATTKSAKRMASIGMTGLKSV